VRINRHYKIFLAVFLLVFLSSCSVKKNTLRSRAYHNLTSYYNIYYNAYDSYKGGIKRIDKSFQFNFDDFLPIFYYSDAEATASVSSDMDRVIRKSSKLITRHSIKSKPKKKKSGKLSAKERAFLNKKEYCAWVDEAYLLIGKSRVYKGEFPQAIQTFNYVKNQFTEKESIAEANLWIAKIFTEQKDFNNALDIYTELEGNKDLSSKMKGELYASIARLYHLKEDYNQAASYLNRAIEFVGKKADRVRYTYILAQYYQKVENYEKALESYNRIMDMSPKYEMAFNAQINMASSVSENVDNSKVKAQLLKMLKDEKNKDFQDQIYYGLAELTFREGDIDKAIEYYLNSALNSSSNMNQKGISFLRLANIYFDREKYTMSKAYFDSSLTTIESNYPNYEQLFEQTSNLNKLVTELQLVEREDSLQKMAALPEAERNVIIDNIIQKIKDEEERLRQLEEERRMDMMTYNQNRSNPTLNPQDAGKWYFYNQATVSYGQNEFKMKWGNRKLEDNWRRRNKRVMTMDLSEFAEEADSAAVDPKKGMDNKSRDFYLADLPLADSSLRNSKLKVENALFRVGEIYKNDFKNFNAAAESFKVFVERFPYSEFVIMAYYYLYDMGMKEDDFRTADIYKNLIINKYPNTKYAEYLKNPEYFNSLLDEKRKVDNFYEQTYNQYITGNYSQVVSFCDYATTNYKDNHLRSKFSYLKALASGELYGGEVFKDGLTSVIAQYSGTDEAEAAKELLNRVKEKETKLAMGEGLEVQDNEEEETMVESEMKFEYNEKDEHYFALIYDKKDVKSSQLKFVFVSLNVDHYLDDNLEVDDKPLNGVYNILTVKSLKDAAAAGEYFLKARERADQLEQQIVSGDFKLITISAKNHELLIQEKSLAAYLKFYQKNYLGGN